MSDWLGLAGSGPVISRALEYAVGVGALMEGADGRR